MAALNDNQPPWYSESAPRPLPRRAFPRLRFDPGRRGVAAMIVLSISAVLVSECMVQCDRPEPHSVPALPQPHQPGGTAAREPGGGPPAQIARTVAAPQELIVSVVGLVQHPGLVHVAAGARVTDALAAAGGPVAGADLLSLNLAQRLSDGDQILLGAAAAAATGVASSVNSGSAGGGSRPAAPSGPVNLNTATEQQLDALPGVGPATAAAIVAWRRSNGRFTDLDQLREIQGIGPAKLARLRPLVKV